MGKRSTTSTKSGKFMNPTDQARKEARRRELKKNKKQRLAVRSAVLKSKDPRTIVQVPKKMSMLWLEKESKILSLKVILFRFSFMCSR